MIYVVGLGPGDSGYLTEAGKAAINKAGILIGGQRHLDSIPDFKGQKRLLGSDFAALIAFINENEPKEDMVVLASGDPLLYGIGKFLSSKLPKEKLQIISGISAIQYFFSKLQLDMNDLYITSSHGKEPNFDLLLSMEKVAMVTDQKIGPSQIATEILKRDLKKIMWVGENLSYPNEQIYRGKPEEIVGRTFDMNVVVIVDEK